MQRIFGNDDVAKADNVIGANLRTLYYSQGTLALLVNQLKREVDVKICGSSETKPAREQAL
jgi:hypothetical protein